MNPNKIKTIKPFKEIFPIDVRIKNAIKKDMKTNGYDKSKPIDVWNGICIDGHTRLQAAKESGIDVVIFEHKFKTQDEAIRYAIHNQSDRRNLTDAEIMRCVQLLDKRKQAGRPDKLAPPGANLSKSSSDTAETIGISQRKVEKTRTLLDHATEKTKKAVESGQMSINWAYKETQERRAYQVKKTFNATNEKIEWAKWTWNPVTGCEHGCKYCYARDIANRNFPNKFKPTLYKERLSAPANTKIPNGRINEEGIKNVFVCSMGELFGEWVSQEWIDRIMESIKANPQWNYLFLTKNPKRLVKIDFPPHCWVGATIDTQSRVKPTEDAFRKVNAKIKFISCEPLLEPIKFNNLDIFDWIIIGGQSETMNMKEFQPKWEWVESLVNQARRANCKIYMKPNLKSRIKEYPEIKERKMEKSYENI